MQVSVDQMKIRVGTSMMSRREVDAWLHPPMAFLTWLPVVPNGSPTLVRESHELVESDE